MADADDILTTVLNEATTCSRCFAKTVTTKQRGSLGHTPCSDNCGSLNLSMESEPISYTDADRRAKNLLKRLEEHDISIDEDAFKASVEKSYGVMSPDELFIEALEYGLGNKDPDDLEPDTPQAHGRTTKSGDSDEEEEEKEPIKNLAESPISERIFDNIEDADQIADYVNRFETPDGLVDILYITHPQAFKKRTAVSEVGDHSQTAQADAVVRYNWGTIKANPKRKFGRWIDGLDTSIERDLLSAAVLCAPSRSPVNQDNDRDPLRESGVWPIVKERVSQRLLGLMKRSKHEYFTLDDLCELVEFRDQAVKRVVYALETNNTLTPTNKGWVYSGDEVEFNEEQARFWQKD